VLLIAQGALASEQLASQPSDSPALQATEAVVRQPRAFGYFVGDLLTQYVRLELSARAFEPAELPRVERVGVWFERRSSSVVSLDGERWLRVEYQIINAPRELRTVQLPGWRIEDASSTQALAIPAASISIAPLTSPPADPEDPLRTLRPDRSAPRIATASIERRLFIYLGAFAVVGCAWLAWFTWRNWRARRQQPFARAWDELRELDERAPEAWQAIHRAIDRTAGRVTQRATLATLFERAPHLAPRRELIERFYAQSTEFFFGRGLPADALSVRELCRELRQLEKRHER
jgi:mxaA protein